VTGERALFVSPGFTRRPREIRGFTPAQSERILQLLWLVSGSPFHGS
jgi:taurine dioxygenase